MMIVGFILGLLFVAWCLALVGGWWLPFTDGQYLAWCLVWTAAWIWCGLAQVFHEGR